MVRQSGGQRRFSEVEVTHGPVNRKLRWPEMMRQGKYADIVSRGEAIYQQLEEELEGSYRGQYVAINIVDGKYAVASSELQAIDKAKELCDDSFVGYLRGIGFVDFFGSV